MKTQNIAKYSAFIALSLVIVAGCGESRQGESQHTANRPDFSGSSDIAPTGEETTEPEQSAQPNDVAKADVSEEASAEKPKREPIYDPDADAKVLIANAVAAAKRDNKHILIEWGGNWCGWCYKLHDVFHNSEDVEPVVYEEFELVLIDSGSNRELMESYGGKDRQYSYPHLTVLDADGDVLTNQNTEPLEEGDHHDPAKVAEFLKEWSPTPLDAQESLTAALEQAGREEKHVLVHVGTPYCGWCKVLSRFLADHEQLLGQDFIDLKIDTLRMTNGKDVAGKLQPGESLGIPWMVILDASGKVQATSVGPDGNCGYPVADSEIDHFLSMLKQTRNRLTDDDLNTLRNDLEHFRIERERRRKEQA